MNKILSKFAYLFIFILLFSSILGCSNQENPTAGSQNGGQENPPEITLSWGNSLHTALPEIPLKRIEQFKERGIYLNPLSEDKFELIDHGKKLAIISYIPNKGASEVATFMGQGHLDSALCSNTGILTAIDKGTDVKILCPVQTGAIALVFPPNTSFYGWKEVKNFIKSSKVPVKIGYHSPVSAPRVVLESVLKEEGFKVTEDPNDVKADVLLVDLKGTNNLIPSMTSKQVDAWVGPAHFPETAEHKNLGKIVLHLDDFPPKGKWDDFPCCVFSVRNEVLSEHPEVFKALAHLLEECCKYWEENRDDASEILAESIGIEKEVIKSSRINFTTEPTEKWLEGIDIYIEALNEMGKFDDRLKGMPFEKVIDSCFDFSYIKEAKSRF